MRRKPAPRYLGLSLVVPDGVVFEDRLTGEKLVRTRTEQQVPVPGRAPVLTPA